MAEYPSNLPQPSYGTTLNDEFMVEQATFGDGYEQSLEQGPNNIRQMGKFTYSGVTEEESKLIRSFVRDLRAVDTFDWTPPDSDTSVRWKTGKTFTRTFNNFNNYDCTFDVKQVFNHG